MKNIIISTVIAAAMVGVSYYYQNEKLNSLESLMSRLGAAQKISELSSHATPIDADSLPIVDSTAGQTKRVTWANVKATAKTYFDTLYSATFSTSAGLKTILSDETGTGYAVFSTSSTMQNATMTTPFIDVAGTEAKGDVLYLSDNGGTLSRIGIGSAGEFLGVSGGIPSWTSNLFSLSSTLSGLLSDETGTGYAVFSTSSTMQNATMTTPFINVDGTEAKGDLLYLSDNGGTLTRLGIGNASDVLTVSSGLPAWAAPGSGSGSLLQASSTDVTVSGGTLSTLASTTIPANTLLSGKAIEATLFVTDYDTGTLVADDDTIFSVYINSTQIAACTMSIGNDLTNLHGKIDVLLVGDTSTAQDASVNAWVTDSRGLSAGSLSTGCTGTGTGSLDMTQNQALSVKVDMDGETGESITVSNWVIRKAI